MEDDLKNRRRPQKWKTTSKMEDNLKNGRWPQKWKMTSKWKMTPKMDDNQKTDEDLKKQMTTKKTYDDLKNVSSKMSIQHWPEFDRPPQDPPKARYWAALSSQ